jgi:hypothetical protein
MAKRCCPKCTLTDGCQAVVDAINAEENVQLLHEALVELLRFASKPQPRDEEEQEQIVAKVALALRSTGWVSEKR